MFVSPLRFRFVLESCKFFERLIFLRGFFLRAFVFGAFKGCDCLRSMIFLDFSSFRFTVLKCLLLRHGVLSVFFCLMCVLCFAI